MLYVAVMNQTPLATAARAPLAAGSLAAVCALLAPACTSSGGAAGGGGGGGGSSSAYCTALGNYFRQCNLNDPCSQAEVRDCAMTSAGLSDGYLNATTACAQQATCGDAGVVAGSSCVRAALANLQPTAAQQKLATDYCNVCATAASQAQATCVAAFYVSSGDGGIGGPGVFLFPLNDTLAQQVDQTCIPALSADAGPLGCALGFEFCAFASIGTSLYSPPECKSDAGAIQSFDGG